MTTDDAGALTRFKATAIRGDQTCEISKVELLDLLGNCIEQHEVCTKSGLSDLVVMAFSVLNHKYWPYVDLTQEKPDYLALDVYGANEMSLIIENYNNFFPDVSGKQVHDEWTSIKRLIVKKSSLMLMPFKQLWARMLSMFTAQFPLILRVVAIAMTFTTDTSGCERLISLMNDLQTVFQSRMGHDCLRSQMWWSAEMHRLTYSEWQSALPRMVRRWNKNRRHQCDDDAASTAAAVSEAEAHARCDLVSACTAEQSCKIDSYADLCGL